MKYFTLAAILVSGYLGAMQPEQKEALKEALKEKKVAIRTYDKATDRDAALVMFAQHPQDHFISKSGNYSPKNIARVYTYLMDREDPERSTKVLTVDGDVEGFLTYYFLESRKKKGEKHQGYIELLAVTDSIPEPQRTNYEKQLLAYALQQIQAQQPDKTTKFVNKKDTRMINLLRSEGWIDLNGAPASSIWDQAWEFEAPAEPQVKEERGSGIEAAAEKLMKLKLDQ